MERLDAVVKAFYKGVVPGPGDPVLNPQKAEHYYRRYIKFIADRLRPGAKVLEVGCRAGLSTAQLSRLGYDAIGVDLCHTLFRRHFRAETLKFVGGDALHLPFAASSCDAVSSYQTLEHVFDPARAFDEMIRVLRPGGLLFVAGPNLISPIPSLVGLFYSIPRDTPARYWFSREPGGQRFPFGTTYPECLKFLTRNLALIVRKSLQAQVFFVTREPDFREPAHADSDSCYLLNPIDVVKYLKRKGLTILSSRAQGPLWFLGCLSGGTWVVAQKGRERGGGETATASRPAHEVAAGRLS